MPSRLIRSELIESERIQTLPVEARWMFVCIALSADDLGLFEASPYIIGRRSGLDQKNVPALLQLCADADLVRLYESAGKRYLFIPRFRQRLQIKRSKFPRPPDALMADDDDATSKFNNLGSVPTVNIGGARNVTVAQPPEPEPEPEEEQEITMLSHGSARPADDHPMLALVETITAKAKGLPDCPHLAVLALWAEVLPQLPQHEPDQWRGQRADHLRAQWRWSAKTNRWTEQAQGLTYFRRLFLFVAQSKFLTGQINPRDANRRVFYATLEWLVKPANWAKTIEGNYHQEQQA